MSHCKEPCPGDICIEMTKAGMCGRSDSPPKKRVDLSEWAKVDGVISEAWLSPDGELVILGKPAPSEDELAHNCDAMGCGMSHVLWRGQLAKESK